MGGFIGTPPGCDPDIDPFCIPNDPSFGPTPIIIVADTGTAAAIQDISALQQVLGGAVGDLKSLAGLIINGIGQVLGALTLLWTTILKPLLSAIQKLMKRISDIIDKVLKPYLQWMKQVRALILDIYNRFVRPWIVLIQRVRRVIAIFRLLHIHVLDGLDKQLAKLEGKLLKPIIGLLRQVNGIGNWISFILDLRLLLHRGLLLGSATANKGGLVNIFYNAQMPPPGAVPPSVTPAAPPTFADTDRDLRDFTQAGAGTFQQYGAIADDAMQQGLAA
jgi:hypothetical protein